MLLRVGPLPAEALAASAAFHADVLPRVIEMLGEGGKEGEAVTLVFAPAPHAHCSWRAAALQTLSVARAPRRINALASADEAAIAAAQAWLDRAPGITGHYLELDGIGAGPVV